MGNLERTALTAFQVCRAHPARLAKPVIEPSQHDFDVKFRLKNKLNSFVQERPGRRVRPELRDRQVRPDLRVPTAVQGFKDRSDRKDLPENRVSSSKLKSKTRLSEKEKQIAFEGRDGTPAADGTDGKDGTPGTPGSQGKSNSSQR